MIGSASPQLWEIARQWREVYGTSRDPFELASTLRFSARLQAHGGELTRQSKQALDHEALGSRVTRLRSWVLIGSPRPYDIVLGLAAP